MPSVPLKPWYREPWPWILMIAPASAVIGGVITTALAISSFDGLVAEDYYKQGLAVNQVLARAERAQALGLSGRLSVEPGERAAVRVDLHAAGDELPPAIRLSLSHPTRAGLDQQLTLVRAAAGVYAGRADALAPGRWNVIVEDTAASWRIRGALRSPTERSAALDPRP